MVQGACLSGRPRSDELSSDLMIAALAGRRIDGPGSKPERFPLRNVDKVRGQLRVRFTAKDIQALVCSAACGADLIALDIARELGIRFRIILPFEPEEFRSRSVIDRPGQWGPIFDAVVQAAVGDNEIVVLDSAEAEANPFEAATRKIIEEAEKLASAFDREKPIAIAVWDGIEKNEDDQTAEFINLAGSRGMHVIEIPTL